MYHYTALVTLLAIAFYFFTSTQVARARYKYGVKLPAISGHPDFERVFRVQMNTLEQLVIFVPAMLLFAHYVEPRIAAALGVIFVIGRFWYFRSYVRDPRARSAGFGVSFLPNMILLLGGLIGAAIHL